MVITSGCGSEYPGSIPGSRPKKTDQLEGWSVLISCMY